jgi:hypothetical protein
MQTIFSAIAGAACLWAVIHLSGGPVRADVTPAPAARFIVRTTQVNVSWASVKIDTATGDGWTLVGTKWQKITDTAAPPAGNYDILILELRDHSYMIMRVEQISGRTWLLNNNQWAEDPS